MEEMQMLNLVKGFLKDEEGMGTIEIVVIIAVLVGLALIFKDGIANYANKLMNSLFDTPEDPSAGMKNEYK